MQIKSKLMCHQIQLINGCNVFRSCYLISCIHTEYSILIPDEQDGVCILLSKIK